MAGVKKGPVPVLGPKGSKTKKKSPPKPAPKRSPAAVGIKPGTMNVRGGYRT